MAETAMKFILLFFEMLSLKPFSSFPIDKQGGCRFRAALPLGHFRNGYSVINISFKFFIYRAIITFVVNTSLLAEVSLSMYKP